MAGGAEDRAEVFELRPLLYPALPTDPDVNPTSPAALARSLRCAEPFGAYTYLGSTDGKVFVYVQPSALEDDEYRAAGPSQDFRHIDTRPVSSKPIERIIVMPGLAVAAVLSEATLTFYELPTFLPIPQQVLPHIKGVTAVALDDQEALRDPKGVDREGLAGLCIIRRKMIMLVKLSRDTWRIVKEIPLTGGATNARRFGDWLCISTFSEYNVVNLKDATLSVVGLPISQTTDNPSASSRPSIVSVCDGKTAAQCEFLITSHSEELTLGVFIGQEGEPTAKLLEWPSHPRAICLQQPYVHALLRNDTIQVHDLNSMQLVQTVHLPSLLEPRTLSSGTSALEVVEESENMGMSVVRIRITAEGRRERMSEVAHSWRRDALEHRRTRSDVLMTGKNAVQGLFRSNILGSAIRALHRGDVKRAMPLADTVWDDHAASLTPDSLQALELEYVNQLIAVESIRLLNFDDAWKFGVRGRMDYRLWLSLFPTLTQGLPLGGEMEMCAKVADVLDDIDNLETFPLDNIVRNYCPPLNPGTHPSLLKLQTGLAAKIEKFLGQLVDTSMQDTTLMDDQATRRILDTVHARILIKTGDGNAVSAFLRTSTACDMNLIEPQLEKIGCYAILADLHQERKQWAEALDLQTRLLDRQLHDDWFKGTTQGVAELLSHCQDAQLVHRYGIWLVQRDSAAGVKALMRGRTGSSTAAAHGGERETLRELQKIDEKASLAYLEAIALTRKHQDPDNHRELADVLLKRIQAAFAQHNGRTTMERITEDYIQGAFAESFVAHLTLHVDAESVPAVSRLKLMALLQGSSVLDPGAMLREVEKEPLLSYEKAILLGKLGDDKAAFEILAVQLRDANSAETYCSQDRRPVSLPVLQSVHVGDLKVYCALVARSLKRSSGGGGKKQEDQLTLLSALLHVYMSASRSDEFQIATTHLLNTQAMHLNTKDILATVPSHWSVRTLETFLSRSLRRETHRAKEGQIERASALAQNLEVAETLWSKRRALGGVIEDGTEERGGGLINGQDDLGRALVEKVSEGAEKWPTDPEEIDEHSKVGM